MNLNPELLYFIAAILICAIATWILLDPGIWRRCEDWKRRRNNIAVKYIFTMNGKKIMEGFCDAVEAPPVGKYTVSPELQLGELMIVPSRYITRREVMVEPPVRVDKNDVIMLEIKEI